MKKGTVVVVWRDNGDALLTRTRSAVKTFPDKSTVVFVEGISGCYSTKHVRPVTVHRDIALELAEGQKPATNKQRVKWPQVVKDSNVRD